MKRNFLKAILPACALMLAIAASLAFASAEKDVAEDVTLYTGYYVNSEGQCRETHPISSNSCQPNIGGLFCTIRLPFQGTKIVYASSYCNEVAPVTVLWQVPTRPRP